MSSNKPALLFIHGFRGNSSGLKPIAEQLSDTYQVFLPNLPPAEGQSILKYTPERYADWVASYITKNRLKQPVLIGHSMGSLIAAATAKKYPHLVHDQLILLAPLSKKPNWFFTGLSPFSAILPKNFVDYITTRYLMVVKDKELFKEILEATHNCSADYKSRLDIFKTAWFSVNHSVGEFDLSPSTLLIAGEHDRLISKKHTLQLAEQQNLQYVALKSTGHLLNYECPHAVAEAIRHFLASAQ